VFTSAQITFVQLAAVAVVACVLILNAANDLFAVEPTGMVEPGGGPPVRAPRYVGRMANGVRRALILLSGLLAAACTTVLPAILWSMVFVDWGFARPTMSFYVILVISATVIAATWIAYATANLRLNNMRTAAPAQRKST
jgi:hypothetical protein